MLLLAADARHCAHIQGQVPDQLARGQLSQLQHVLHVVHVVHQEMALVHTGHNTWEGAEDTDRPSDGHVNIKTRLYIHQSTPICVPIPSKL